MDRRRGHYLGTESDEKWWKRYTKEGFFAHDFSFRRSPKSWKINNLQ